MDALLERFFAEGENLFEQGKYDEALEKFNMLLKFKRNHENSIAFIGRIYVAMDEFEKAKESAFFFKFSNTIVENLAVKTYDRL